MIVPYLQISDKASEIRKNANIAICEELNKIILSRGGKILADMRAYMKTTLSATPEYDSLVNGVLKYHFGFPKGSEKSRVDAIVNKFCESMELGYTEFKPTGQSISGNLTLYMIVNNFVDVLSLSEAIVTPKRTDPFNWLSWFLTQGDKIIIADYRFEGEDFDPRRSRSGGGIMEKDPVGWRVPEYGGVPYDNWFVRAVLNNLDAISLKFVQSFVRIF